MCQIRNGLHDYWLGILECFSYDCPSTSFYLAQRFSYDSRNLHDPKIRFRKFLKERTRFFIHFYNFVFTYLSSHYYLLRLQWNLYNWKSHFGRNTILCSCIDCFSITILDERDEINVIVQVSFKLFSVPNQHIS